MIEGMLDNCTLYINNIDQLIDLLTPLQDIWGLSNFFTEFKTKICLIWWMTGWIA